MVPSNSPGNSLLPPTLTELLWDRYISNLQEKIDSSTDMVKEICVVFLVACKFNATEK